MAPNEARGTTRGEAQQRARREKANVKLIGRESERGHAVRRKPDPKQLGRANILGALSRVVYHVISAFYIP